MDTLNNRTDYHLVLRGNTYPELREAIRRVAVDHGLMSDGTPTAPAQDDEPAAKVQDKPAPKATGRKGGKKADAEKEAEPEKVPATTAEKDAPGKDQEDACTPEQETGKPASTETRVVTLEEARTQLMAYVNEHGATKGKALVDSFGVGKMSDLADQPDKLADLFVKAGGTL